VPEPRKFLSKLPKKQLLWVTDTLRKETTGGVLLLVAAAVSLVWANVDFWGFSHLRDLRFGPSALHLSLSLGQWASDGLLAIFFFVAGLELKHELVLGSLKDKSVAAVPVAAALGGMLAPALVFFGLNLGSPTIVGWGIPMATDIAFALAVLAVVGKRLPIELRAFLLTLAVVDDLGAILVIAIFYTAAINFSSLLIAAIALILFWLLQRNEVNGWYFYLPIAAIAWFFLHQSGIHATIAGVAMGLMMNLKNSDRVMHLIHPISAGIAVPVFAFFSSGVNFQNLSLTNLVESPVALGILFGLVLGKPIGILSTSWLLSKFSRATLSKGLSWWDVSTVGLLAGVGFTVALLINELAFKESEATSSIGTVAVLASSTLAALLATIAIQFRKRAKSVDQS
jgi:NhaA family Na+:H+ antiporter